METRLKELRSNKGIKQIDIGKIIGMSQRGYSHYETGKEIPNECLIKLACYYDTSIDYILRYTDEIKAYKKNKIINNRLRDLREDKDLSQKKLGEILGLSQTTYTHYENGTNVPIEVLLKLANFYNTSTDYILGLTNEIKPYPKVKR